MVTDLTIGPRKGMRMNWKPNKWAATVLAMIFPPLGMLYLNQLRLAGYYFALVILLGLIQFWLALSGFVLPLTVLISLFAAVHAYRISVRAYVIGSRAWFSRWYGLFGVALAAISSIVCFRAFVYEPFHIPSQSMRPSIPEGAYIVVQKFGYGNYKASHGLRLAKNPVSAAIIRGDVMVFEYPNDRSINYVFRVIGLPGDHIEYRDKRLLVNGKPLSSEVGTEQLRSKIFTEAAGPASYQVAIENDAPAKNFSTDVNAGHLFLMGDNRDNANDSRYWGQLPYDHLVGKVVYVLKGRKAY